GGEETQKGVVGGNAVAQLQADGPKPGLLGCPESGNGFPGSGATKGGGQGDDQDIGQRMAVTEVGMSWVGEVGKVVGNIQWQSVGGDVRGRVGHGGGDDQRKIGERVIRLKGGQCSS